MTDWKTIARDYVAIHAKDSWKPAPYDIDDETGLVCFCTGTAMIESPAHQWHRVRLLRERLVKAGFPVLGGLRDPGDLFTALVIQAAPGQDDEVERVIEDVLKQTAFYSISSKWGRC